MGELLGVGVAVGEFEVEHLDERFRVLCCRSVGSSIWVRLRSIWAMPSCCAVEADFSGGEEIQDGLGRGAVAVLQFGANIGEIGCESSAPAMRLYMRRRWFSSGM